MAEVWMLWEGRKRENDATMNEARYLLLLLPSCTPLPHQFLSHLNALLVPHPCLEPTQQPTAASPPFVSSFPQFQGPATAAISALVRDVDDSFMKSHGPPGNLLQSIPGNVTQSSSHHQPSTALTVAPQYQMNMQVDHRPLLDAWEDAGVRFVGQHAATTEAAVRAMHTLQVMQERECEVFVDMQSSQLPGVLLNGAQLMGLWGDHVVSQVVPPDFMELCQIAATQHNRKTLFKQQLM